MAFIIDIEKEKRKYCKIVSISPDTYTRDDKSEKRTREIFKTFARVLRGRSSLPQIQKEAEMKNLSRVVQRVILNPILRNPRTISNSQAQFDQWHKTTVTKVKRTCLIRLTVGIAQKIINLHCKDLWALQLVPECYSRFFHPIIDKVTLEEVIGSTITWTQLKFYGKYMRLQSDFKAEARKYNTYPLAVECFI